MKRVGRTKGLKQGNFPSMADCGKKCSLKVENSAHNWNRQHVNSLLFIDEPGISPLGAAVQLLFSLPPVWAFPSPHLGIPISAFFNWISFVFVPLFVFLFSDSMHLPSSSLGFPFPSFGTFPSPHLGLSMYQFPFDFLYRVGHGWPWALIISTIISIFFG